MVKKYFRLMTLHFSLILVVLLPDSIALNNDSSLKLYLAFDEKSGKIAKDHSKSRLEGRLSGKAKFVKNGKFGGALSLEDSNSLVQLPATDELNITKSITIAAFFANVSVVISINVTNIGIKRHLIKDIICSLSIWNSLLTIEKTSLNSSKSAYLLNNEIK